MTKTTNSKLPILNYLKEGDKTLKKKNKKILYFKKDEDKDKKRDIIGYAKLETNKIPKDAIACLDGVLDDSIYVTRNKHGLCRGYIKTTNDQYVGIYKHSFLFLILGSLLGVYLSILLIWAINGKPVEDLLPIDPGVIFDNLGGDARKELNKILEDDPGIDFPIYSLKEFVVDDENPVVKLGNPETNIVLFQYIITNQNGDAVYKTDLIKPGRAIAWTPKNYLSSGTYNLQIETKTYTSEHQTETNGFKTSMKLTIR